MAKSRRESESTEQTGTVSDQQEHALETHERLIRARLAVLQSPDARHRVERVFAKRGRLTTPVIVPDSY